MIQPDATADTRRKVHKPSARVSFGLPGPLSFQVRSHAMVGRRSGTNTRQGKRQGQAAKQLMRCPEFHGRVRTYSAGRDGVSAHFEHRENNPGCTLGYNFDGTRRRHRKPGE